MNGRGPYISSSTYTFRQSPSIVTRRNPSSSRAHNLNEFMPAFATSNIIKNDYQYLQPGWLNNRQNINANDNASIDSLQARMEQIQRQLEILKEEERRDTFNGYRRPHIVDTERRKRKVTKNDRSLRNHEIYSSEESEKSALSSVQFETRREKHIHRTFDKSTTDREISTHRDVSPVDFSILDVNLDFKPTKRILSPVYEFAPNRRIHYDRRSPSPRTKTVENRSVELKKRRIYSSGVQVGYIEEEMRQRNTRYQDGSRKPKYQNREKKRVEMRRSPAFGNDPSFSSTIKFRSQRRDRATLDLNKIEVMINTLA